MQTKRNKKLFKKKFTRWSGVLHNIPLRRFVKGTMNYLPESDLVEVFPDMSYRIKSDNGKKKVVFRRGRRETDAGAAGDKKFLASLRRCLPPAEVDRIHPVGILFNASEDHNLLRRGWVNQRLRRLWKKGEIRRFEHVSASSGVWYKLEKSEGFLKKEDATRSTYGIKVTL